MTSDPRPVDEPDDGGEREAVAPPDADEVPPKDAPVGDFGDDDQADRGGDSDPEG